MMLYVRGTDIRRFTLAGIADDHARFVIDPVSFETTPEFFLSYIFRFLEEHPEPLTGIVAVQGPGSATALRTSITIVNTFAFTRSLPMFGISLAQEADDAEALILLLHGERTPILQPIYEHDVRITPRAKDALHRR